MAPTVQRYENDFILQKNDKADLQKPALSEISYV